VLVDPDTGKVTPLLETRGSESFKGVNDLFFAANGDLYFTDQGQTGLHDPTGRVYRYDTAGRLTMLVNTVPSPNGLVLNKAETVLYVGVTRGNAVWRLPLMEDGTASKVGLFIQMSGGHAGPDGMALDEEAREKGNSVYFPDRVEPMLPERLSNGLCSLREGENRATMAVRMVFNANGRKISHRFVRGLMRSAAKLSYEQAQAAIDGQPDDKTGPLLDGILKPLWTAYSVMLKGREARSPLAIESEERRVVIGADGQVDSITKRASLEAHRLIEEMMIQANVSAAETLEQKRTPLIYRIHDTPSPEKMQALTDFLQTLDIPWSKGEAPNTHRFNRLLDETREGPHADIVNEVVLRSQMQAQYNAENIGHFGLNLAKYAHFTSPIRRYADLIVHRGLIRALGLGGDGLTDEDIRQIKDTAERITHAERRAMAAERDATDRYVAAFMADKVGAEFAGRITGVTRFGLFVRLVDTGADGLVPVSSLGGEFFVHDDRTHALVGDRTGARWPLGMAVQVRLREATPVTGGLLFEMLSEAAPPDASMPSPRLGVRRRFDKGKDPGRGGPKRGGVPKGVRKGKRR